MVKSNKAKTVTRFALLEALGHPSREWLEAYPELALLVLRELVGAKASPADLARLLAESRKTAAARPFAAAPVTTKIPGVGLPLPPLPEGWRANWCPQLRLESGADYVLPPAAVAAGWNYHTSCPLEWTGWFAEHFVRTVAALRCGWEEDRWGSRQSHDGNFTILEFEYAEVFIGKGDPIFQSPCYLASDAGKLPVPVPGGGDAPLAPGTPVEVLIGDKWIPDEVESAAGGRTIKLKSGRRPGGRLLLLADEGRTWRRTQAPSIPPPPPGSPPVPPSPPIQPPGTLPPLAPLAQRVEELRALLPAFASEARAGQPVISLAADALLALDRLPGAWMLFKPLAVGALGAWRRARRSTSGDPRPLP